MTASLNQAAPAGAGERTREALILAGERLFAERGIDAVSLRQINVAAGQRNSSAAHYHFGSKDALVQAIYAYRMARVNDRRLRLLDELTARGAQDDVRTLVEAVIRPVVDEIRDSEAGSHYIRFLAQVAGHPQVNLARLWHSEFAAGLSQLVALLRAALPHVPDAILGQRFGLMWEQTIHALADQERLDDSGQASRLIGRALPPEVFVSNLVDMVASGLAAPVSEATRAALTRGSAGAQRPRARSGRVAPA